MYICRVLHLCFGNTRNLTRLDKLSPSPPAPFQLTGQVETCQPLHLT